jgi:hypothetical protein
MEYLLRRVTVLGFWRGLRGSRRWIVIGICAVGIRTLRRLGRPREEVFYRTQVRPGDRFLVHVEQP